VSQAQVKRYTLLDFMGNEGRMLQMLLECRCWNLLGIKWTKYVEGMQDPVSGDYIIRYE
jgi:hypothetical protein